MLKKGVFKGCFIVLPLDTRHVVGTGQGAAKQGSQWPYPPPAVRTKSTL